VRAFAALYDALDATTATQAKVDALVRYFAEAPPADAAWAVAFLTGRRPKRLVKLPDVRRWAAEAAGVPDWLFEEAYAQAGDLAETISLLVPARPAAADESAPRREAVAADGTASSAPGDGDASALAWWVESRLLPLAGAAPEWQRAELLAAWRELDGTARFVFNKLITGAFRVGVSDGLVVRALAVVSGLAPETIGHRLMGQWEPSAAWYRQLFSLDAADADWSRPYPFFLAHPLDQAPEALGAPHDWLAEWKWDGIRAQLVRRRGRTVLWSRGEELLAGRFPELEAAAEWLPDGTVLDGEILAWRDGCPLPFSTLQRRLNRKTVGASLRRDVPVHLLAYDCLEQDGRDVRGDPLATRRARLERVLAALPADAPIGLSPLVPLASWDGADALRDRARAHAAEGLMLKRRDSAYGVGRRVGDWYKWKVAPYAVDAVLVYAQAGHGRRAGLYTDYTFAVWDGDALVPFAKAYSGLTDGELREVDRFIRAHTREKFGPVRTVEPRLVFELAFEGIQASPRHRSGVAVRFPRIARWRRDKPAAEADTLATVKALLVAPASRP
jgi:DNA ligase-1